MLTRAKRRSGQGRWPVCGEGGGGGPEHGTWVPRLASSKSLSSPNIRAPPGELRARGLHCMAGTVFRKVLSQHVNMENFHPKL